MCIISDTNGWTIDYLHISLNSTILQPSILQRKLYSSQCSRSDLLISDHISATTINDSSCDVTPICKPSQFIAVSLTIYKSPSEGYNSMCLYTINIQRALCTYFFIIILGYNSTSSSISYIKESEKTFREPSYCRYQTYRYGPLMTISTQRR